MGSEFPISSGFVDILYQGNKSRIPCEVKLETAGHDIVTQIEKYLQHFYKYLHYNHWDYVQGITIAKDYSDFAYNELQKLDVLILRYYIQNNFFYLEKIG